MGTAQAGKYTDGRLDDIPQSEHLTRLTDARLKNTYLRLFV